MMFGKRRKKEWERAYGSYERVWWFRQCNCLVCGRLPSQNAHTKNGGMSMKGPASSIVPLCSRHHRELHDTGRRTFEAKYKVDLASAAEKWDARWQAHKRGDRWLGF